MGIDTEEVLLAVGNKRNFLPLRSGLVGRHCIGVDAYCLTHEAQEIGYHPEMILAGTLIGHTIGTNVAGEIIRLMAGKRIRLKGSRVLVLGLAVKENCPDLRNSKVVDVFRELQRHGAKVDLYDPWVESAEATQEYGIRPVSRMKRATYDGEVLVVAHQVFKKMNAKELRRFGRRNHIFYDIKSTFPADQVDGRR